MTGRDKGEDVVKGRLLLKHQRRDMNVKVVCGRNC